MEKKFIATGKDFDVAVQAALKELGLAQEDVTIQLLERPKAGLFGIGARPCKIEVTYEVPDPKPASALSSASRSKPKAKAEAPKAAAPKAEAPKPVQKPEAPKAAPKPQQKMDAPKVKPQQKTEAPKKAKEAKEVKEPKTYAPAAEGTVEAEIERFLTGLMAHMGATAVPHAEKTGDNNYQVELVGQELGMLIGRRGETLDAIQHLTNYAINRTQEGHIRIGVDAEDYRVKREDSLRRYARKKAQQVLKVRRRTTLEPMNAYERHVIHAALQDMENITTHSTGTEPNRRVIIEYVR